MKRLFLLALVALTISGAMASQSPISDEQQPMFIIDGKVVTNEQVKAIPSSDIESMTILKDGEAASFANLGDISNGVIIITLKSGDDKQVLSSADVMPTFMGGDVATFQSWLMKSMRYPAEALSQGLQDSIVVSFVVNREGYIDANSVEFLEIQHNIFKEEICRVLSSSPRWTPAVNDGKTVAIKLCLPVVFSIPKDDPIANKSKGASGIPGSKAPIYIVNGRQVTGKEIDALDPTKIANMTVLKAETAVAKYAHLGDVSNGVVEITLHSNDDPVYDLLDVTHMPQYMGGDPNTFTMWVYNQVRYPEEAKRQHIEGRVIVSFIVNSNGYISSDSLSFLDNSSKLLQDEVRRVMLSSDRWTPAKRNGQSVAVRLTLPVEFRLQRKDKS